MNNCPVDNTIKETYSLFFEGDTPVCAQIADTSRGDDDFRNTLIITTESGEKRVLKFAANDFTFPEKIRMWQRTVNEYRALGCYCPLIINDRKGGFPLVRYKGRDCVVYAEEFSKYSSLEDRTSCMETGNDEEYNRYLKDIWTMTAKIAAKKLDYTDYPSAYCLFETFCPSDKTDEVYENALEWKAVSESLPSEFSEQAQRIWRLWCENRENLRKIYKKLPTSVFQADLNPTNILIDDEGCFRGVFDFNLCGKDVFLNYLMRENNSEQIGEVLKIVSKHYRFSKEEKDAALLIYRCVKPLWWSSIQALKEAESDAQAIHDCLDRSERMLTDDASGIIVI